MKNKIWLVEFPTHQYKEDVNGLAYENRLEIIDIRFKDSIDPKLVVSDKDAPKLTKAK
jgi:hypothetical protein|tara:strand:+ start:16121 stop:16294 length:174 start_codon:yes stop_codon:yes gene_type:complete